MKLLPQFTLRLIGIIAITIMIAACNNPWKASADAAADIQQAKILAKQTDKHVLLEFGANWCPDSQALARTMRKEKLQTLVSTHFVPVRIDVGYRDRNLDIVETYGSPIEKGMPALVIITPTGSIITGSYNGEFGNARKLSADAVFDYLNNALQQTAKR